MRLALFDARRYDRDAFERANAGFAHALTFHEARLTATTAALATGFPAVCAFVNDRLDAQTLGLLADAGVRLVALRCAGFNHVDLTAAAARDLVVVRVPDYSPYAVAEHAVALLMCLNRKLHRANARVREWNFSLDGLVGFDLHGKTVGVVGLGRIGMAAARIFGGFGCRLLAYDPIPARPEEASLGIERVPIETLFAGADVISLHLPLTPATHHLVDAKAFARMKPGVVLVNTSRGGLVDASALLDALKSGKVGGAGLDVYEGEAGVFFSDWSGQVLQDDVLARLLTFPNVLVSAHQAFLTHEALGNIAQTTLQSVRAFERGEALVNRLHPPDASIRPPRP